MNSVNFPLKDETYLSDMDVPAHEPNATQSNNFQASFTLLKCFIGAGILALPYSFYLVGITPAILMMLFIGVLTYYCATLLMKVADEMKGIRLETMAYDVLGKWGMYSVEISVSLHQFGTSTATLIFGIKFLNYLVCNLGFESVCDNVPFEILVCVIVVIPLSMINNLHWFYIPSIASSVLALTGISTQMSHDIDLIQQNSKVHEFLLDNIFKFNVSNFPLFIGVAVYLFEGMGTFFNIRAAMATPTDFTMLLKYQMTAVVLLFIVFASTCYLALGDNIPGIVLFSLPVKGYYIWIVGLYAIAVLLGYPLRLFPLLKIMENSNFLKSRIFDERLRTKNPLLRYGLRVILTFLMLVVVFTAKSLNLFLSFVGSCISTYLAFILPILMYNKYFSKTISNKKRNFNNLSLIVGLTMGAFGVVVSLADMLGLRDGPPIH